MSMHFYPSTPAVSLAKISAVSVTGAAAPLFTVSNGSILLRQLIGRVTTVVGAVATTILVRGNPTVGADTDLCTGGVITNAAAGSMVALTGTMSDALTVVLSTQGAVSGALRPIAIAPGTIDRIVSVGGTTGAMEWMALWEPIEVGASLA